MTLAELHTAVIPCILSMNNRSGPIRDALSAVLAPLVAADGGKVYIEELEEQVVSLHWAGRYAGSPAAGLLHEEIAVPLIQQVAPGTVVRWSSGAIIPSNAVLILPIVVTSNSST